MTVNWSTLQGPESSAVRLVPADSSLASFIDLHKWDSWIVEVNRGQKEAGSTSELKRLSAVEQGRIASAYPALTYLITHQKPEVGAIRKDGGSVRWEVAESKLFNLRLASWQKDDAATCSASIPSVCRFESLLLHFPISSLLPVIGKQQMMTEVFGPLPPMWDIQMEFQASCCSWT